jgi:DNA-binding NtrC family response regulator
MEYDWPGNVRELENLVERELIRHRSGHITFDTVLPREVREKIPPKTDNGRQIYPLNLDEAMAVHMRAVLNLAKGKIHGPGGAAELLGMNPNTLRWRLDKLGICYRRRDRGNKEEKP